MSIYDNVAAGLKLNGIRNRKQLDEVVQKSLAQFRAVGRSKRLAAQKVRRQPLRRPAAAPCIAALSPSNPKSCSWTSPALHSTRFPPANRRIIFQLKEQYTIVIVTHNMQQAARVAEFTGFFLLGKMIEFDKTEKIFTNPSDKRTEDYVTGRFG